MRHPLTAWLAAATLGAEAQWVIALRMMRLAAGGALAATEAQRWPGGTRLFICARPGTDSPRVSAGSDGLMPCFATYSAARRYMIVN